MDFLRNKSLTTCTKNLSDVYKNVKIEEEVTEHSFVQGELGNCGMVVAMASLAGNKELYKKVVPEGQRLNEGSSNKSPSEFVFNLHKCGKQTRVSVDQSLTFFGNCLLYSKSFTGEFSSSLLEKALIKLHFDGNYNKAEGVAASDVFTSFTNSFFEQDVKEFNGSYIFELHDLISYGVKSKCLMAVVFKENISKLNLFAKHYYTLVGMNEKFVEIYNPHGRKVFLPKTCFFDNVLGFEISYIKNKIYKMPQVVTSKEFTGVWSPFGRLQLFSHVVYDLSIEEDHTDVLINLHDIDNSEFFFGRKIFVVALNENDEILDKEISFSLGNLSYRRLFVKKRKYKVVFTAFPWSRSKLLKLFFKSKTFENNFLIRFAASKYCKIEKSADNSFLKNNFSNTYLLWKVMFNGIFKRF